jgi:pantoate--beta-alanine ligase
MLVFAPPVAEMFPDKPLTTVRVAGLSEGMEGDCRPGHFDGVATIVSKLFAIAGRCRAYFGEKDFQQLGVVGQLVHLSFPVQVVGCPTVRDADGLALSSRNANLSRDQREAALILHRALCAGAAAVDAGETDPRAVAEMMAAIVKAEPDVRLDYAEVVDPPTLHQPAAIEGEIRLLVAAGVGRARLIDNIAARAAGVDTRGPDHGG